VQQHGLVFGAVCGAGQVVAESETSTVATAASGRLK